MRIYSLVERATGEVIDTGECSVERLTGVEINYIDWAIEQDGRLIMGSGLS